LIETIIEFMADDLNTSAVIDCIKAWVSRNQSGETGGDSKSLIKVLDSILGLKI
jgi:hypothetical protein